MTEASTDTSVDEGVSDSTLEDPGLLKTSLDAEPVIILRKDSKTKVPENQKSLFQKFIAAATTSNSDESKDNISNENKFDDISSSPEDSSSSSPSPPPPPSPPEDVEIPPPEPHSLPPKRLVDQEDF